MFFLQKPVSFDLAFLMKQASEVSPPLRFEAIIPSQLQSQELKKKKLQTLSSHHRRNEDAWVV